MGEGCVVDIASFEWWYLKNEAGSIRLVETLFDLVAMANKDWDQSAKLALSLKDTKANLGVDSSPIGSQ